MPAKFKYLCLVGLIALGCCQIASAELAQVGPVISSGLPGDGFPSYYMDQNGLTLGICPSSASDANCLSDPVTGNPFSTTIGFGANGYYWLAKAQITAVGVGGTGTATLQMDLRASFSGSTSSSIPADGNQITFSRIEIGPITGLNPGGAYRVTYPFGVLNNLVADSSGAIPAQVLDIGCATQPCNFSAALSSSIGPFLKWDPSVAPAAPSGYIGNPGTTSTPITHAVIGSPFGTNYFKIEGSNAGGTGVNQIQTNQFIVQGKIFTGTVTQIPLSVLESTYTRPVPSAINVFATSASDNILQVIGTGFTSPTLMTGDGSGNFFKHIPLTGSLPSSITVTATSPSLTQTSMISTLVDVVTITQVEYNSDLKTLTIEATSSDAISPPTLTAVGFGNLTAGKLVVPGINVPPAEVTVTSSAGGSDTAQVTITANVAPVAKNDVALTLINTPVDINVIANDIGKSGPIDPTTVTIKTNATHGGTSVNAVTGVVTYTPNAGFTGKDKFTYTVEDIYGTVSNVATVNITVVASDTLSITKATYTKSSKWYQISGKGTKTAGNVITIYLGDNSSGPLIGTATVNALLGSWSFSKLNSSVDPGTGTINVTAVSTLGKTYTFPLTIK